MTRTLSIQDYHKTLFDGQNEEARYTHHAIQSKKQHLYSVKEEKVGLSSWDTKRYILDDGFTTLPYLHKNIQKYHFDKL